MLANQLETAWTKSWDAALESTPPLRLFLFNAPRTLNWVCSQYLMALYRRPEFDSICGGPDRHKCFTDWAIANWESLSRDIDAAEQLMYQSLQTTASTRPIKA